ncbi:MAG: ATP synthase F1 subunit delta [Pirellulales bacterium]
MIDSAQPNKARSTVINVAAQQVATVYAKALLGAAEKAGQAEAAVEELAAVAETLVQFPKLEDVLSSALIDHEEKCQVLDRVFGSKVSSLVLDFLKVVSRHGRLDILRPVAQQSGLLYDELRGRVRVGLQTATPLADGQSQNLTAALRTLLGGEPLVEPTVDPALIGGVVLRVGDTVYDGSVARQLRQVREQMITRSIHEIQSGRDRFRHSGGN